ncbi:MAG: quinone oxidoreductase family protein [Candidatus Puniceispirillales bacterium]
MAHAYCADQPGGVEVLEWRDLPTPAPGPGEVVIGQTKIGLNFIDVYMTSGIYPFPEEGPQIPGSEAAGVVTALGEGVSGFAVGDRVAYTTPNGAYREERVMPAAKLVKLPDEVSDEVAAAAMLKGMTVEYLLNRSFRVTAEDAVLFHAAAGGVGLIAGQWLRHIGATSIGTVGSDEKLAEAKAAGYTHVINYNTTDFTEAVAEITGGKGVSVAYDSVGQATYPQTLKCLRKFGLFVSFGQSSGVIKNFATGDLAQNGSLYAQRPTLFSFIDTPESLAEVSGNLFSMLADGHVSLSINQRYALKDVPAAFDALINRRTTGATVFDTGR